MTKYKNNILGSTFMSISTAAFIFNDTLIKYTVSDLNIFQTMFVRGIFSTFFLGVICIYLNSFFNKIDNKSLIFIFLRVIADVLGTLFFLTALFNLPLANLMAIIQVIPLMVTFFSYLFLKEKIGSFRLLAIFFGLCGVLLIIKPNSEEFNIFSIYAVIAVLLISFREITTRKISYEISPFFITFLTIFALTITGGVGLLLQNSWTPISLNSYFSLSGAGLLIAIAFLISVPAMKYGDISFVSPFRYTLILWAVFFGYFLFGEKIDISTISGILIVVFSGIFMYYREYLNKKKIM